MLYRLEFSTLKALNAFLPSLGNCYKVINQRTRVIVCKCPEEITALAKEKFGANVIVLEP